ncbi:MAG: 4,5-DOPA dioxygenase extradiol [Bdellovibrionota bacterium]|nr:4,5-DOPA dioxygenase extradiol [Bdellovibrionota bacterium]
MNHRRYAILKIITFLGSIALAGRFLMNKLNEKKSKMPSVFIGHGSPMNAVVENAYTKRLSQFSEEIEKPKAILVISAHWLTEGTQITAMAKPKTIHDFYGFPKELFEIQYPAQGSSELVNRVSELLGVNVKKDFKDWGLDHGTWAVLKHIYPKADVPVVQLSIDKNQSFRYHYEIGKKLSVLREEGYLILGSGNIVHNLRTMHRSENAPSYDWAIEFDEWVKENLTHRNDELLFNNFLDDKAGQLSVPTAEHYIPMLYALGASDSREELDFIFEQMQNASVSMRSFRIG